MKGPGWGPPKMWVTYLFWARSWLEEAWNSRLGVSKREMVGPNFTYHGKCSFSPATASSLKLTLWFAYFLFPYTHSTQCCQTPSCVVPPFIGHTNTATVVDSWHQFWWVGAHAVLVVLYFEYYFFTYSHILLACSYLPTEKPDTACLLTNNSCLCPFSSFLFLSSPLRL